MKKCFLYNSRNFWTKWKHVFSYQFGTVKIPFGKEGILSAIFFKHLLWCTRWIPNQRSRKTVAQFTLKQKSDLRKRCEGPGRKWGKWEGSFFLPPPPPKTFFFLSVFPMEKNRHFGTHWKKIQWNIFSFGISEMLFMTSFFHRCTEWKSMRISFNYSSWHMCGSSGEKPLYFFGMSELLFSPGFHLKCTLWFF